jgi:hypothetical protein
MIFLLKTIFGGGGEGGEGVEFLPLVDKKNIVHIVQRVCVKIENGVQFCISLFFKRKIVKFFFATCALRFEMGANFLGAFYFLARF